MALLAALLIFAIALVVLARAPQVEAIAQTRNFYGVLHVTEDSPEREESHRYRLLHGRITHGYQYRRWDLITEPTSYLWSRQRYRAYVAASSAPLRAG